MAEAVENRRSAKTVPVDYVDRLKKPLRDFRRELTGFPTTSALRRKGAKVVAAEFKELSGVIQALGLDVVISFPSKSPKARRAASPLPLALTSERAASDKPAGFDPVLAGLKLAGQMKQAEGGAFTGSELKSLFGLSSATQHSRREKHGIVFWRDAKHDFHYPKWQFTPAGALIPGIQEVLRIFKSADEWRIMGYFLGPRQQLNGRTPLDLLRQGNAEEVTAHARLHESENSW